MKHFVLFTTLAALLSIGSIDSASAQTRRNSANTGSCPVGTMSSSCTARAFNAKNCTVANYNRCTGGANVTPAKGKKG